MRGRVLLFKDPSARFIGCCSQVKLQAWNIREVLLPPKKGGEHCFLVKVQTHTRLDSRSGRCARREPQQDLG